MPATSLTVSFSSGDASNARPNCVEQQLLPATYIRRKARDGSVPRSSRSFSAATAVISIIASPLSDIALGIMLTRRPSGGDAPRSLERLETVRALVPPVQETRLRPSATHRDDLVDGRDPPTRRPLPVAAQRADIHHDGDLSRLLVRHAVAAADDLDRLVCPGGVYRGRECDVRSDPRKDLTHRRAPDVTRGHRVLA